MEFPFYGDRVYDWDDTMSLLFIRARNSGMIHGPEDAVEIFQGREAIYRKYIGEKAPAFTYQFGSEYRVEPPPKPPVYKPPWWEVPEVIH
ncbi:hypothetical protein ES702_05032 [subsurface metagenome]